MHPEQPDTIQPLAAKIREYQHRKQLSDTELCRRFPALGSTKTYTRILIGDLHELDTEKWSLKYRSVLAVIESGGDDVAASEDLYDDLTPVIRLKRALLETMTNSGNDRLIILEGDSGAGKTVARQLIQQKYGPRVMWVEASVVWGDSPNSFLGAILKASGLSHLPPKQMDRLEAVQKILRASRTCLIVDEAHHFGPKCLNTLKTLCNDTPGEFVLLTLRTLWKRLECAAYEEARQLTGNRLHERLRLDSLSESDVRKFLERRCRMDGAEIRQAVRLVSDRATGRGNLAFVRDVCKRAVDLADGEPVNLELIGRAVQEEVASR